jgi:WD40-like Beta Propeller Repeat
MRRAEAGIGLACMILAFACCREPRRPRKTHLARLPASVGPITVADDATSYAYRDSNEPPVSIVRDGVAGPAYPAVSAATFSPITRRLFYWAGHELDRGFLVVDGKTFGEDIGRESTIVFSSDGAHWATTAALHDRGPGGTEEPGPAVVFADDRELGSYPDASLPAFSPDGRHLAYLVAGEEGANLIVDGAEQRSFARPLADCAARPRRRHRQINPYYWPLFQVRYLSDGRLLVMTQDDDGWGIYRDRERLASYEASIEQARPYLPGGCGTVSTVAGWTLTTAERAPLAAWWERVAGTDERWRVVVDGKPVDDVTCAKAWNLQPPEFSPDGRHLAYACAVTQPEERVFLVADGRRYGPYWGMWAYSWADDGSHFAYGAAEGPEARAWRHYVDGKPRSEAMTSVWRPLLEPGTGRLVWQSRREEGERGMLGIDRRRIASFDDVVWGPQFLRPGTATWVIRRGQRLIRLDVPVG